MFRRLTRLLFGGEEEVSEDVKSGEVVDDGWLVVPQQEEASSENQDALSANKQQPNAAPHKDTAGNIESDSSLAAESSVVPSGTTTSRVVSASSSKPEALIELRQFTSTQRTKDWPVQQHVSRNAIQRQNRARQGLQHHSFHLQQPGPRSHSH